MRVFKKSGSVALTGIAKKAYDGTSMLAGMETAAATEANLGDHMELKLANTGTHTALDNFA